MRILRDEGAVRRERGELGPAADNSPSHVYYSRYSLHLYLEFGECLRLEIHRRRGGGEHREVEHWGAKTSRRLRRAGSSRKERDASNGSTHALNQTCAPKSTLADLPAS